MGIFNKLLPGCMLPGGKGGGPGGGPPPPCGPPPVFGGMAIEGGIAEGMDPGGGTGGNTGGGMPANKESCTYRLVFYILLLHEDALSFQYSSHLCNVRFFFLFH